MLLKQISDSVAERRSSFTNSSDGQVKHECLSQGEGFDCLNNCALE